MVVEVEVEVGGGRLEAEAERMRTAVGVEARLLAEVAADASSKVDPEQPLLLSRYDICPWPLIVIDKDTLLEKSQRPAQKSQTRQTRSSLTNTQGVY